MQKSVLDTKICASSPKAAQMMWIVLTVEEVESLVCDLESMDQDMAAERMNISRGTLQRILYPLTKDSGSSLSGQGDPNRRRTFRIV